MGSALHSSIHYLYLYFLVSFITPQSFEAGNYLDMLFIKSPSFPEKMSFSQLIRISNFSFIQYSSASIHWAAYYVWGSWSAAPCQLTPQFKYRFSSKQFSAGYSSSEHLIFHQRLHSLDKQQLRSLSNKLYFKVM